MATHSIILAWEIPWTAEPGGRESTGWQKVGHHGATNTFTLLSDVHRKQHLLSISDRPGAMRSTLC